MEDLKAIWNQLNTIQVELGNYLKPISREDIISQLEKEEQLQKQFAPWLIVVFILFLSFFSWIVYQNSSHFGAVEVLGIALVAIGSLLIMYLPQQIKIPLDQYRYEESATNFMKLVKDKITQRKQFLVYGLVAQFLCLTAGIFLLITGGELSKMTGGFVGLYFGTMLALAGFGIGGTIALFNQHYRSLLEKVDLFLGAA